MTPDHVHFLATVTLEKTISSIEIIETWLVRLVDTVNMRILCGPFVVKCQDVGNEGITGIIVLSTSHCSVHIWDLPKPYLKMDLYSCRRFSVKPILDMLKEFGARVCEYQVIDRNHTDEAEMLVGSMFQLHHGKADFRLTQI